MNVGRELEQFVVVVQPIRKLAAFMISFGYECRELLVVIFNTGVWTTYVY